MHTDFYHDFVFSTERRHSCRVFLIYSVKIREEEDTPERNNTEGRKSTGS